MVDTDKKRLRSCNIIFMEEKANRHNGDEPAPIIFPIAELTHVDQEPAHTGSAYIEEVSDLTTRSQRGNVQSRKYGVLTLSGALNISLTRGPARRSLS